MLQLLSKVKIIDNSGVVKGKVIKILTSKNAKIGRLGNLILISSQKLIPKSGMVSGAIFKALIVQAKLKAWNPLFKLKWDENGVVLVKLAPKGDEYLPIGSRIKSPISVSLKNKQGFQKIISLAKAYV